MNFVLWCRRRWFLIGLVAIPVLPWMAFAGSLSQGYAPVDDSFLIFNNPIVHGISPAHLKLAFTTYDPELYIPLTLLSFQVDWLLGGGNPVVFHVTNLLLQSLNAVLVGVLVGFLLQKTTYAKGAALVAGMIFAIHPIHTEAVVWAAGRKDLLSMFFFLLSTLLYLRATHGNLRKNRMFYVLSILLFALGLMSKVLIATLPAVLLLYDVLVQKKTTLRKTCLRLSPFFFLSASFLYIASFGKQKILASSTLLETAIMAQKSAFFYLQKIFIPTKLTVIYPFEARITLSAAEFFLPLLAHLAIIVFALRQWHKRPIVTFGILFYFVTLSPTFFNFHKSDLYFFAVDRYAYIPSIGILLAVMMIGAECCNRLRVSVRARSIGIATLLLLFIALSQKQTSTWKTSDTLFGRSISIYPTSAFARMALGSTLREQNRLEEAFKVLHDGAQYSDHAGLNVEAGLVYAAAGQVDDARTQFRLALTKNPALSTALFYLGFLHEHEGHFAEAIDHYSQAIALDPSYVTVRVHLARLLMEEKRFTEARDQLMAAYEWNPVSQEVIDALITLDTVENNHDGLLRWQEVRDTMFPSAQ